MTKTASREARWLDVSAERFAGWISSFAERHSGGETGRRLAVTAEPGMVTFTAADGAVAQCYPPYAASFTPPSDASPAELADAIAAHATVPRTVGVLLVRLGGYAAGVFTGYPPALADSKVGSRLVHGRSAAGGWSQHRFARRREKQASEALSAAADAALSVFGRWPASRPPLDSVVLGGDKRTAAELRDDPRLVRYLALEDDRFITVPDPKRAVLESAAAQFSAVRIKLTEPPREAPQKADGPAGLIR